MIHEWPIYAAMLQQLVGDGASAPTDCASMWLVLHKHGRPVTLVAEVLAARFSSLVDARQFEGAQMQTCGRLLIDAAQQVDQQTGSSAAVAHARQLRYRMHAAQNEHAAAARELEASLALAPSSRPHLWVELARTRYALKGEEAGALLGAAEALEAAIVLTPTDKSKWAMRIYLHTHALEQVPTAPHRTALAHALSRCSPINARLQPCVRGCNPVHARLQRA